ncbi:unnamed protein product [Amoebophrya sp. A120]|nr:unnamed protein product [Amoebophrya sp. A120]|eukprot:GSA120T00001132001.1
MARILHFKRCTVSRCTVGPSFRQRFHARLAERIAELEKQEAEKENKDGSLSPGSGAKKPIASKGKSKGGKLAQAILSPKSSGAAAGAGKKRGESSPKSASGNKKDKHKSPKASTSPKTGSKKTSTPPKEQEKAKAEIVEKKVEAKPDDPAKTVLEPTTNNKFEAKPRGGEQQVVPKERATAPASFAPRGRGDDEKKGLELKKEKEVVSAKPKEEEQSQKAEDARKDAEQRREDLSNVLNKYGDGGSAKTSTTTPATTSTAPPTTDAADSKVATELRAKAAEDPPAGTATGTRESAAEKEGGRTSTAGAKAPTAAAGVSENNKSTTAAAPKFAAAPRTSGAAAAKEERKSGQQEAVVSVPTTEQQVESKKEDQTPAAPKPEPPKKPTGSLVAALGANKAGTSTPVAKAVAVVPGGSEAASSAGVVVPVAKAVVPAKAVAVATELASSKPVVGPAAKQQAKAVVGVGANKMGNCATSTGNKASTNLEPKGVVPAAAEAKKGEAVAAPKKQFSWEKKQTINKKDYMLMDRKNEVIVKEGLQLQQFLVDGCENCDIFVLDPMATVSVDYSKNCRIFMAPIESSIFVRNCENCQFVLCVQQFRSRECTDCKIALFSQTDPIIEYSNKMEFSCWPISYFSLKSHLDVCKINPYSNKWNKIFDFNKKDDGSLNYSLSAAYNASREKLAELIDFAKCTNTEFRDEIFQFLENPNTFAAIPVTLGKDTGSKFDTKPENRVFVLFLDTAKLELFLQAFHDKNSGNYEVLQTRVLGLDESKAKQLQVLDVKALDFGRGEVPCIGLDLCGEGINAKVSDFEEELKGSFVIPRERLTAFAELFFVTLKDDEGMAHGIGK